MNARLTILILAFAVSLTTVYAGLNDTPAQFETRYGRAVKTETGPQADGYVNVYQKNDLHVRVRFVGERAQHVVYFRPDGCLSIEEAKQILDANEGFGGAWKKLERKENPPPRLAGDGAHWRRQDKAEAFADQAVVGKKGDRDVKVKSLTLATSQWLDRADKRF